MFYFTPEERRALVFLCCVLLTGLAMDFSRKYFARLQTAPAIYARIGKLDLNLAAQEELESLPGVGKKLAKNIYSYRQQHGFLSVDDLLLVPGIGARKFERLKDFFYLEE